VIGTISMMSMMSMMSVMSMMCVVDQIGDRVKYACAQLRLASLTWGLAHVEIRGGGL
jgi:hypothetical protein